MICSIDRLVRPTPRSAAGKGFCCLAESLLPVFCNWMLESAPRLNTAFLAREVEEEKLAIPGDGW